MAATIFWVLSSNVHGPSCPKVAKPTYPWPPTIQRPSDISMMERAAAWFGN